MAKIMTLDRSERRNQNGDRQKTVQSIGFVEEDDQNRRPRKINPVASSFDVRDYSEFVYVNRIFENS